MTANNISIDAINTITNSSITDSLTEGIHIMSGGAIEVATICFDRTMFFIIVIGIILMAIYYYNKEQKRCKKCVPKIIKEVVEKPAVQTVPTVPVVQPTPVGPIPPLIDQSIIAEVDMQRVANPLVQPERRISSDAILPGYMRQMSTRGTLDTFHQSGIITKIGTVDSPNEKVMPLFSRRKYPHDTLYEYYSIIPKINIKIPITVRGDKELFTDDVIFIKELNSEYKVQLYKLEELTYNPYVI